jgi:Calx-beta domain
MELKGKCGALKGIFGMMVIATALTGCGGSSTDSASSTNSAASSTSSVGPVVDRAAGTIALSSATYEASAASGAIVTIYRSGSGSGAASATYATANGSAVAGTDYTATSGSLTWNAGDTSSRIVVVPVAASALGKSFAISLISIEGQAGFGNPSSATIQVSSTAASNSSSSGSSSSGTTTDSATLQWTAPTDNTDGSALTNLVGYNIYYGTSSSAMTNKIAINTVGITNYVIQNLQSGNWYFAMTAVNSSGVESALTSTVEATL